MSAPFLDPDYFTLDAIDERNLLAELHKALERGYAKATDDEEEERQARIAAGVEHACAGCGCSESRACPGGCVWATATLCSRCVC